MTVYGCQIKIIMAIYSWQRYRRSYPHRYIGSDGLRQNGFSRILHPWNLMNALTSILSPTLFTGLLLGE